MHSRMIALVCRSLIAYLALLGQAWGAGDFTFLHVSDPHVPHALAQTRETLAALPPPGDIRLAPYEITVPGPCFAMVTGDLNEFGGGSGWWEQYRGLWRAVAFPVYQQLGNHDNTWDCGRPRLRQLHGSAFYSFEESGIKFIGWDTATPQDPRPSVAAEGLRWLEGEFERTPPEQPVMLFCHHPLDGREFAGEYDRARLLDVLRTRNVVLLLVGHGHGARAWQVEGFDTVMGGSTFGPRPGYGIVSLRDDVVRVCHQYVGAEAEMVGLLEKALPERSPFLKVTVSPPDGSVFTADQPLAWSARVEPPDAVREARWTLDGEQAGQLTRRDNTWVTELSREGIAPGAHVLRLEFADLQDRATSRTLSFWTGGGPLSMVWKQELGGSCQSTPVVSQGRVYVGANDGTLSAFEAATGSLLWRFATEGEVRSQPATAEDGSAIYFGSANGWLYAVGRDGGQKWRFEAGSPIYGSPIVIGDRVVCGTNGGEVVAVEADTGAPLWRSEAPEYAIETAPCADEGGVYTGSWDRYVYAVELDTGELRWRRPSAGSDREGFVARYYSPADCGPAVAGANVFVVDRAYYLTVLNAESGERVMAEKACVAVSASADGGFVYVRHTDGRVSKRSADGGVVWTAQAPTGAIATPPVAAGGYVWVISNLGTLTVLAQDTGERVAQQRVFRDLYAFAAPAFDGDRVYVADMAGGVTALAAAWLGEER